MRGARPERALDVAVRTAVAIARGSRVLAACSGGPDSVALASLLDRLGRRGGFDVVLGHVDHGTRASALQDECVALSVGARLGRRVAIARVRAAGDDEAALRTARYDALAALARATASAYVATAHTAEDQTETVLLALFRGTGPAGLAGMPRERPLAPGIALVRPVLRVTRAELATELRRSGLPWAVDPTNAENRYRRNALRPHLAALREAFPHLDRAVARCAQILRDELDDTAQSERRRRVRAHLRVRGGLRDITFERIDAHPDR